MANPEIHAKSSAKRWGGNYKDYIEIHELIDSPKVVMNNNTARTLTHNTWFAYHIIPKIFGYTIVNSAGRRVETIDIAMLHIAEDFKMRFVPTAQDYLKHLQLQPWMNNGVQHLETEFDKNSIEQLKQKEYEPA